MFTSTSRREPVGFRGTTWVAVAYAGLVLCLLSAAAASAEPFELEGSWFVVAHYTDEATANPDVTRWVDEVWTFEKKGSRMQWTKYPLVIFDDTSGRFEALGRNPRSRVLEGWEPNQGQLAQILKGPRVNSRGSKTKALKGSASQGWKSVSRMQVRSATAVGYQENWEVSGLDDMPLFSRQDMLGLAGSTQAEGGTTFQITALGDRPSGAYQRDGVKQGTFFLIRTPHPRGLEKKEGTVNERFTERATQEALRQWNEEQRKGSAAEE